PHRRVDRRQGQHDREAAARAARRRRRQRCRHQRWPAARSGGGDGRRACAQPRTEGEAVRGPGRGLGSDGRGDGRHRGDHQVSAMSRFNISKWAIEHPALTRYLLVVFMALGLAAYFQLGQDEDPPFTFRAMVVRAYWPGATGQQIADQVTDKIEKTLQEVPYADKIRSYSKPGETLIIFQVKDSSPPKEMAHIWYTVRKKLGDIRGTLPAGVIGPFYNDEFGDVYGSIYALSSDGFTYEELKQQADRVRQRLLKVKDVN